MNLIDGQLCSAWEADRVLEELEQRIAHTLSQGHLDVRLVINACHKVATSLDEGTYLQIITDMGIPMLQTSYLLDQVKKSFTRDYLSARLDAELGVNWQKLQEYLPPFEQKSVTQGIYPLGVLFHIAAGNMDGLPAFSVVEGLLSGNINILKLPEVDNGLSVHLLRALIEAEPKLIPYLYVFDYSSRDTSSITKLIQVADAVVVWGGDSAVSALRRITPPNTRLIEWGHKISFAYATPSGINDEALSALAQHICSTRQLLCSSCQGIYLDTSSIEDVHQFCRRFLPLLESAAQLYLADLDLGIRAQVALQQYSMELDTAFNNNTIYRGELCSLTASPTSSLTPSVQFGNCWVKPLPSARIIDVLHPYKNHLQTVGLLAGDADQPILQQLLWTAGAVRVTSGKEMSYTYCGAAHDGEFPLRCYTRIVSTK